MRAWSSTSRPTLDNASVGGQSRAIVTGGAGFIGSHLVDALVARSAEVHVVDNLATGSRENLPAGAELHELDVRDEALEELAGRLRPEVVFHLAAQADVGTSVERPAFYADVNVVGTVRVLEAARAAGARVVFSSTGGAIYGECEQPAREQDPPHPLSPYAASKLAGEGYLATWNRLYGSGHVTCRLANVYGPRQRPTLEGGVVAIFLDRFRDGREAEIFGDGSQTRDFVFVADVVQGLLAAASLLRPGSTTSAPEWAAASSSSTRFVLGRPESSCSRDSHPSGPVISAAASSTYRSPKSARVAGGDAARGRRGSDLGRRELRRARSRGPFSVQLTNAAG
jgi:UDP-glucose 4-epimerase